MAVKLKETSSLTKSSNKWLIQLISEGVGSSAVYPGEILQRDGAVAWPAGSHIYADHLTETQEWENHGNHSIRDLVGVTLTEAVWDEDSKSLRAEAKWFNGYETFIEDAKDYIGLSIEASASVNDGVVENLLPSPHNAIAVVPRAGRDGKVLQQLSESYREKRDKIIDEGISKETGKDEGMTPEDIQKVAEAVAEAIKPSFTAITEALKPAEPVVEGDAPKIEDVAEAVATAELPKAARARVYEAVKAGTSVEDAIAAEKDYIKELTENVKPEKPADGSDGRVREYDKNDNDYRVGGW